MTTTNDQSTAVYPGIIDQLEADGHVLDGTPEQEWQTWCALQRAVGGWHPDDDPFQIIHGPTGRPLFDEQDAATADRLTDSAFAWCGQAGIDIYAWVMENTP